MNAGHLIRAVWFKLSQPSLLRRLVLAQTLLLVLVWAILSVLLMLEFQSDTSELEGARHEAILAVSRPLLDRQEALREALARIDLSRRLEGQMPDEPRWRVNMLVWHGTRLVYMSPGLRVPIEQSAVDRIETVTADGERWRALTKADAASGLRVTLAISDEPGRGMLTLASRSLWVLPLLISAPLLILPAWGALQLALRPWRRLSDEVASRGMANLAPLVFRPAHKELKSLALGVDALLQNVRDGLERERSFIADAAHELRTPVAAMRVHAEALHHLALPGTSPERLQALVRCSDRASRLVEQMLALIRADARSDLGPQRIAVDKMLRERLGDMARMAGARGVELDLDAPDPVPLWAERQGLTSLIDNLVDNAIKYSPAGGVVLVRAYLNAEKGAVIEVIDGGPGIPAAWRARVFDRFVRAPDQSVSGSGLGLAIVAAVVKRHGGSIDCEDNCDGGGLRMRVTLPGLPQTIAEKVNHS